MEWEEGWRSLVKNVMNAPKLFSCVSSYILSMEIGNMTMNMSMPGMRSGMGMDPRMIGPTMGMDPRMIESPMGMDPRMKGPPMGMNPRMDEPPMGMNPGIDEPPMGMNPGMGGPPMGMDPGMGGPPMGMDPGMGGPSMNPRMPLPPDMDGHMKPTLYENPRMRNPGMDHMEGMNDMMENLLMMMMGDSHNAHRFYVLTSAISSCKILASFEKMMQMGQRPPYPMPEGEPEDEWDYMDGYYGQSVGESEPEGEGESEPEAEGESEPKAEGESEPKAEEESEPEAEGESEPKAEGESEPEAEGEAEGEPEGEWGEHTMKPSKRMKHRGLMESIVMPVCRQPVSGSEDHGGYMPTQCHGGLCWCVDSQGQPIPHSLSHGHVACNELGVNDPFNLRRPFMCKNGRHPKVCHNACRHKSCAKDNRPVKCTAHPCDDCRLEFSDAMTGRPIHECNGPRPGYTNEACKMIPPMVACINQTKVVDYWYYSMDTDSCVKEWGCKPGGGNSFYTEKDCLKSCKGTAQPACATPHRIYYIFEDGRCYSRMGCSSMGISKEYETHHECLLDNSPDWACVNMNCNLHQVCGNATCRGHPEALCTVDLCTCKPRFVDVMSSQTVDCNEIVSTCVRERAQAKHMMMWAAVRPPATPHNNQGRDMAMHTTPVGPMPTQPPPNQRPPVGPVGPSGPRGAQGMLPPALPTKPRMMTPTPPPEPRPHSVFMPNCDLDGQYMPEQCHGGECWCVDQLGMEITNTRRKLRDMDPDTCTQTSMPLVEKMIGNIRLDVDFNTVMRDKKHFESSMIEQLASEMQIRKSNIKILSITSGSVIVVWEVFTWEDNELIAKVQNFQARVASGYTNFTYDGKRMPVSEFTVEPSVKYISSPDSSNPQPNPKPEDKPEDRHDKDNKLLIIILCCFVGVAVFFMAVVLCVLIKRQKRKARGTRQGIMNPTTEKGYVNEGMVNHEYVTSDESKVKL
jgi:hypothetical protein